MLPGGQEERHRILLLALGDLLGSFAKRLHSHLRAIRSSLDDRLPSSLRNLPSGDCAFQRGSANQGEYGTKDRHPYDLLLSWASGAEVGCCSLHPRRSYRDPQKLQLGRVASPRAAHL